MYFVYILQSEKSGRYYVGHSEDWQKRLREHNSGKTTSTRNKGPWKCVYTETFSDKLSANQRELEIKKMKSRKYIEELIAKTRPD
jgi:putative endonuclease